MKTSYKLNSRFTQGFSRLCEPWSHIKEGCTDELFCAILKYSGLTVGLHYDDMSSLSLATNESGSLHSELRMALAATADETRVRDGEEQK